MAPVEIFSSVLLIARPFSELIQIFGCRLRHHAYNDFDN
jgi:hypothetical protein